MTKLQEVRKSRGLSQSQLADKADMSTRMVQHYEQRIKDINNVRIKTLLKLCLALDCEFEDILEDITNLELLSEYKKRHY